VERGAADWEKEHTNQRTCAQQKSQIFARLRRKRLTLSSDLLAKTAIGTSTAPVCSRLRTRSRSSYHARGEQHTSAIEQRIHLQSPSSLSCFSPVRPRRTSPVHSRRP
jgi:hypothetical protein